MNQIESGLKSAMCKAVSQAFDLEYSEEQVVIEIPKDKSHGDYALPNTAMQLTNSFAATRGDAQKLMECF